MQPDRVEDTLDRFSTATFNDEEDPVPSAGSVDAMVFAAISISDASSSASTDSFLGVRDSCWFLGAERLDWVSCVFEVFLFEVAILVELELVLILVLVGATLLDCSVSSFKRFL